MLKNQLVMMQPIENRHFIWAIFAFLAMIIGAVAGGFFLGVIFRNSGAIVVGVSLGSGFAGIAILVYGLVISSKWRLKDFGFRSSAHSLWHLLWWIPLTVITGALAVGASVAFLGIEQNNTTEIKSQALGLGWEIGAVIFASTAFLLPVIEEIIFRRILLDWLLARVSVFVAVPLVILAFAAIHVIPVVVIYVLVLGSSLVAARLWFKTLTAPCFIHIANNSLVVLVALFALD